MTQYLWTKSSFFFIISLHCLKGGREITPATRYRQFPASGKEILVLIRKVILRAGLAAQRLTVTDFLQVIQSTGDSFIAIGIEGIEVAAGPAVHPDVTLARIHHP